MTSQQRKSRVILLNGAGSAGKGSIARALQDLAAGPVMHVEMDAFFAMLSPRWQGDPSVLHLRPDPHEPGAVAVRTGPQGHRVWSGMRRAAAALVDQGNDLIVDDVILDPGPQGAILAEYRALFSAHDLFTVGVFATLETLESRERTRGDRQIGLARWQIGRVHRACAYDLEIHTDNRMPEDCAGEILGAFPL